MRALSGTYKISADGCLIAWDVATDQPKFITIEGVVFLPIFSSEELLRDAQMFLGWEPDLKIKQIEDTSEFLESVLHKVRVAMDPKITPEGNTRFKELMFEGRET